MILPVKTDYGRYRHYGYKLGDLYHNGHDFDCPLDEEVYSIADGEVLLCAEDINGFGGAGPSLKGGVLIVQHYNKKGTPFTALYGHIDSDFQTGEKVVRCQKLGHVHQYISYGLQVPHLHFCININAGIPQGKWGYVSDLNKYGWVDPKEYIRNNL